jgi:hypothetical protein
MKAATLSELKKELDLLSPGKLTELCIHLAKYKKENKELLTFLLFDADDLENYIISVKVELDAQFEGMNKSSIYLAKKTIRKVLRTANKYIKYSGSKQIEVDLLLYFCKKLKTSGIHFQESQALLNLYLRQVQKVNNALVTLHEDLQYDYLEDIRLLNIH